MFFAIFLFWYLLEAFVARLQKDYKNFGSMWRHLFSGWKLLQLSTLFPGAGALECAALNVNNILLSK